MELSYLFPEENPKILTLFCSSI